MKETGIIMSGDHPRLILDDLKTMTRRVIVPQPEQCRHEELSDWRGQVIDWKGYKYEGREGWFCHVCGNGLRHIDEYSSHGIICPYGQVGDRLWVRETWRIESFMDGEPLLFGYKDGATMEENEYGDTPEYEDWYERVCIQSTDDAAKAFDKGLVRQDESGCYHWDIGQSPCRWRSPRFMPKWAARIWLEITGLRAERLHEISPHSIAKEGIEQDTTIPNWHFPMRQKFIDLWDSLNAKKYPWSMNPWVWPIEYKRVQP